MCPLMSQGTGSSTTPYWDDLLTRHAQAYGRPVAQPHRVFQEHMILNTDRPLYRDLAGQLVDLRALPDSSSKINLNQVLAIIQRFSSRVSATPSSGEIAACFENHLLYAVGEAVELSDSQQRLVTSLCAIANRLPFPLLRQSQYALACLDHPINLNIALVASYYAKSVYLDRINETASAQYSKLLSSEIRRILVVGFSNGAVQVIKSLAKASSVELSVTAANIYIPGRITLSGDALQLMLRDVENVKLTVMGTNDVEDFSRPAEFDVVLTVSKAVRKRDNETIGVINGEPYVRLATEICSRDGIPLFVVTGFFKIWPRALNCVCDDYFYWPAMKFSLGGKMRNFRIRVFIA